MVAKTIPTGDDLVYLIDPSPKWRPKFHISQNLKCIPVLEGAPLL